MTRCTAITRGGERCKGVAIDGSGLCYAHSPNHADARKRAARKGGQRGGRGRPKVRVDEVYKLADKQIEGLFDRSVDPRRSAVAVQWANTKLRAVEVERKLVELAELKQQVAEVKKLYSQSRQDADLGASYEYGGGTWTG